MLSGKTIFTQSELDAYQKAIDEIQQVRDLAEAKLAEGETAGVIKTLVAAILRILETRGLAVDGEARAHIMACGDTATLQRWLARAVTVASAEEVVTAQNEPV